MSEISKEQLQALADAWFNGGCTPYQGEGSAMHWTNPTDFALLDEFFHQHDETTMNARFHDVAAKNSAALGTL